MSGRLTPSLAAALVHAQRVARPVEKDAANAFHRYKYATAEAMMEEGRNALNGAALALVSTGWEIIPAAAPTPCLVRVHYMLVHESGDYVDITADAYSIPEKGRPDDKAVAAALTYNLSYTIRGILNLPRVEEGTDVDQRNDHRHDHRHAPPQARQAPPPARQPPPKPVADVLAWIAAAPFKPESESDDREDLAAVAAWITAHKGSYLAHDLAAFREAYSARVAAGEVTP
jgi:hypothetical protein